MTAGKKQTVYLIDLPISNNEELGSSKTLKVVKRIKWFLESVMNDLQRYVIDKKVNLEKDENMRKLLASLAHKELIHLVVDFQQT